MNRKTLWIVTAIVAISLLTLGSCIKSLSPVPGEGGTTGDLLIVLDPEDSISKSILPSLSMNCLRYQIEGSGPNAKTFSVSTAENSVLVQELVPGTWNITIDGYNDDTPEIKIGEGSGSANVVVGTTAPASITVAELTDTPGALDLLLQWQPDVVTIPDYDVTLKRTGYPDIDMPVVMDAPNCEATAFQDMLDVGWWVVIGKLYDTSGPTPQEASGFADLARIVNATTTTGTVFVWAQQQTGKIEIDIANDFFEELTMTPDVTGLVELFGTNSVTINMSVAEAVAVTYEWYLNGNPVAFDHAQYIVNATDFNASPQPYRLDCIALASDGLGKYAGHYTWDVFKYDEGADAFAGTFEAPSAGSYVVQARFLNNSPAGNTTIAAVAGINNFEILAIPEGEYYLRAVRDDNLNGDLSPGETYECWTAAGGTGDPGLADHVFVPHDPDLSFDFGTLDFSL